VVSARWVPEGLTCRRRAAPAGARAPAAPEPRLRGPGRLGRRALALPRLPERAQRRRPRNATLIWKLSAQEASLAGEFVYPFDPPSSFPRDRAAGEAEPGDLKVCELIWLGPDRLMVLERITRDARLYVVDLAQPGPLTKTLAFTTDDHPDVAQDIEGATLLSDREVLLATDNDFGSRGRRDPLLPPDWMRR
jgi:hypothetical protein